MEEDRIYYGDLHWHTHFSDNRDRASVEQMVSRAASLGLTIVGTGDHNHNLTADQWNALRKETGAVQRAHPSMVLLNNCEMTFMFGHFLVFDPGTVEGTLSEAYRLLYTGPEQLPRPRSQPRRGVLKMINHPGLPTDDWRSRIIPDAVAVEAINGSVLRDAAEQGFRLDTFSDPLQVPMIEILATYAELGIPVAAVGSSDAHRLKQLGPGVTGFRCSAPPSRDGVLEAILHRETFAATDTGVDLRLTPEAGADPRLTADPSRIRWDARFSDPFGKSPDEASADANDGAESWLYRGRAVVARGDAAGEAVLDQSGVYFVVARSGPRFAVSSSFEHEGSAAGALSEENARLVVVAASHILRDRAIMEYVDRAGGPEHHATNSDEVRQIGEIELRTRRGTPEIIDADGKRVSYRVVSHTAARPIIDKECPPSDFDEFYVWLERNEVHECRFDGLSYRLEDDLFTLSASLIPGLADCRPGAEERYRHEIPRIRALVSRAERLRIRVALLATTVIDCGGHSHRYPLAVSDTVAETLFEPNDISAGRLLRSDIVRLSVDRDGYRFPESWRSAVSGIGNTFTAQFFR